MGEEAAGFACNVICSSGDVVLGDIPVYICVYGGAWYPNSILPDCSGKWTYE